MNSLVKSRSKHQLTAGNIETILSHIRRKLIGRVTEAYIFGSASTNEFTADSDIDLILVKEKCGAPFVSRALEFSDLFEVYPDLDILVYTPSELQAQLDDSAVGFWKSVRESRRRIV